MLSFVEIHLALNHFPVVPIVLSLLFFGWGILKNSDFSKRTALILVVTAAIFSIPTFFTGDPASDILIQKWNASKDLIHDHEEAAEAALICLLVAGALAATSWILLKRNHSRANLLFVICFITSIISTVFIARAAHLGGLIRHEELR